MASALWVNGISLVIYTPSPPEPQRAGGQRDLLVFGDSQNQEPSVASRNLIYLRNKPAVQGWVCTSNTRRLIHIQS